MNTELFIARRILSKNKANFSRPVVRIAILSIGLGLTVMFVAVAILTGFQKEVREKVIGFGAHIQISHYDENSSLETKPISMHQDFYPSLETIKGIRHIQVYATKAGIIKTADQIQGIVLKGIGPDYDLTFFSNKIIAGHFPHLSDTGKTNDVLVSKNLAALLKLRLNDDIRMYFISGTTTLGRKFHIAGIYETGLEEFDKVYVLCDIKHIQKLNNWQPDEVGGFEVILDNFNDLDKMGKYIYHKIGMTLDAKTIRDLYPQIFDWLDLQDINVLIILVLMVLVSGITMISTLLILILERTNMIGILKALGMPNGGIRMVFLINAAYIIGQGLFWGNLIGITLCIVQQKYGIITLPQESYYVSVVPVNLDGWNILLLNAGTVVVCLAMLLVPSYVTSRISPVRAIRFS
ncbi:MAG TPA: FtsX-like permease family protein [Bacteroidales bacterium]|nr:FtsX-like permease family protein [Bacteroidales bacterium]